MAPDEPAREPAHAGVLRKTATARVPLWLLAAVVVAVGITFGVVLVLQAGSAVRLGPAVGVAENVEVTMTLCNRDVDRKGINPRTADVELERVLKEEGAAARTWS